MDALGVVYDPQTVWGPKNLSGEFVWESFENTLMFCILHHTKPEEWLPKPVSKNCADPEDMKVILIWLFKITIVDQWRYFIWIIQDIEIGVWLGIYMKTISSFHIGIETQL